MIAEDTASPVPFGAARDACFSLGVVSVMQRSFCEPEEASGCV